MQEDTRDPAQELWELERQTVHELGCQPVTRFANHWPGEGLRRRHGRRNEPPPPRTRPRNIERFLGRFGLDAHYRFGGLYQVLEAMGLTRKQIPAVCIVYGYEIPQSEAAAALGITQQAISLRLAGATRRCLEWLSRFDREELVELAA